MSIPVHPTSKVQQWRPPQNVAPWKLGADFAATEDRVLTGSLKEGIRGHFAGTAPGPLQSQLRVTNQNKRATWDGHNEARYPPGRLVRATPNPVMRKPACETNK